VAVGVVTAAYGARDTVLPLLFSATGLGRTEAFQSCLLAHRAVGRLPPPRAKRVVTQIL